MVIMVEVRALKFFSKTRSKCVLGRNIMKIAHYHEQNY